MKPSEFFRKTWIIPKAQSGVREVFQGNMPVFGALRATLRHVVPASEENQSSTLSPGVVELQVTGSMPLSTRCDFRLERVIAPGRFLYLSKTHGKR
jgi:hypothetical protein